MTAPPIPTVAPQDAWYELTVGNVNPSAADTVPNVTYIQPTGDQSGLIGSLDGEIIYLAGLNSRLDGGQKFLMWDEASLAVQDLVNVFNPWPISTPGIPGRWISTNILQNASGGQIIVSGTTVDILPSTLLITNVVVNKSVGSPTTLNMPSLVAQWQEFVIVDGKGDASINPITISSTLIPINGGTSYVIVNDGGTVRFTFDGSQFRVTG
jgi:hypothetical protein